MKATMDKVPITVPVAELTKAAQFYGDSYIQSCVSFANAQEKPTVDIMLLVPANIQKSLQKNFSIWGSLS